MERRRFGATGLLLVVLVVVFVGYLAGNMRRAGDISYSQLRSLFTEEKVQSFAIENERLTASLRDGTTATCELYSFETFYEDLNDLVVEQNKAGIIEAYDYHADHSTNWVQVLLPYVLATSGGVPLPTDARGIFALLFLCTVNTGFACWLYFSSMNRLPAKAVALMGYFDPVSALIFSALFLDERLSGLQLAGAVLVLAGALVGQFRPRRFTKTDSQGIM